MASKDKSIPKTTKGKGRNYLSVKEGAGMSKIGLERYNRKNNANLKAPSPNPKTEKDKARKKSFCARMGGMQGPTSKNGELTRKGAALKRWGCS
jgi:hypothetical protein